MIGCDGVGEAQIVADTTCQGQPVQVAEEQDLQQQAEVEGRHRDADDRQGADGGIEELALPAGAQDAQRDADQDGEQHAGEQQLEGSRGAVDDLL